MYETEELKQDLQEAEAKLQKLDQSVTDTAFIRRLDREAPHHPALLIWRASAGMGGLLGIAVALVLIAPEVSPKAATVIARFDVVPMIPLPVLLGGLGLLVLLIGFSMRQLAVIRAGDSPLLTGEYKQRQRLANDVHRAQASQDLHERAKDRQ